MSTDSRIKDLRAALNLIFTIEMDASEMRSVALNALEADSAKPYSPSLTREEGMRLLDRFGRAYGCIGTSSEELTEYYEAKEACLKQMGVRDL